ncbi:MAG: GNAT family N-acetyltransferase [Pseudomonadota bacterium]
MAMTATVSDLTLRDAEGRDAPALAALMNTLAVATQSSPGVMTAEAVREGPMAMASMRLRVAVRGDTVLGYTLTSPAYETAFAQRGRYMSDLAVAENARRQGVGQALIRDAARLTAAEGGRFLWWVVMPSNTEALALYDRYDGICETLQCRAIFGAPFEALLA